MQNTCDLLIKNGYVVIPKVGIRNTNIIIENGKIKELSRSLNNLSCSRSIDATGKYILPGLIDPHVHYGVYTPIDKAARTESKSAAIGGVTTMIRMLRLDSDYKNNIKKQIERKFTESYYRFLYPLLDFNRTASTRYFLFDSRNRYKFIQGIYEPRIET